MGISRITLLLTLGAGLVASASSELAEAPRSKAEASATVTVTAEVAPVDLVKTPNPVTVIEKEGIERSGANTLGELLNDLLPGQVMANGGVGTAASLFLGGSRNQDTVVLLDGIRVSDAAGLGGVNFNQLGLAGIDRIEIQQGPCSTRFGSDAMGGVVALYSSGAAATGLHGELRGGLGSNGVRDLGVSPAYGWGTGWLRASLAGQREDQPTETANPFRTTSSVLGFGQNIGDSTLLTLNYRNTYFGVPIPYYKPDAAGPERPEWAYRDGREAKSRSEVISGSLRTVFTETLTGDLSLGQSVLNRLEPHDPYPAYAAMDYGYFEPYNSRRSQATGSLHWLPCATMGYSLVVDAYEEYAGASDWNGGQNHGTGRHIGIAFEQFTEPTANFRMTLGVRHQWDRQTFQFQAGGPSEPEVRNSESTLKVGTNLLLAGGFRLFLSGGTGFSVPFLSAVMYNQQSSTTNPLKLDPLQAEKSRSFQTGCTWEAGPWSAKLETSRTSFENLVYFDLTNYYYRNGQDLRMQSVEASAAYRTPRWGLDGFLRCQEARDMDSEPARAFQSDGLIRRPFTSFGFRSYVVSGSLRFDGHWSWFGSRYENLNGTIGAYKSHFNDVSLGITWTALRALSFSVRGEHLLQPHTTKEEWLARTRDFDNDASQIYGFPAQSPTLSLEARYRF